MLKVLMIHPAATFGGASKSLIELFASLRPLGVSSTVLTPRGRVCGAFAQAGMEVREVRGLSQFDNTRYGYYRRLRWAILLREFFLLPFSLLAIWRLRREKFDLLHINDLTLLPLGVLAKRFLRVPLIVHVRSLQRMPGSGLRTRLINSLLERHADAVVPIDYSVARTLPPDINQQVVHNSLHLEGIKNTRQRSDADASVRPIRVGFLGVLIPLKGVYELIEAVRILSERGVPVHCVIAGENARNLSGLKGWLLSQFGFSRDVRADLESLIRQYGLQGRVELLGFVADVRSLYPTLDILCFPSHLDAAGRPVFEAAFYGVPSVVVVRDPAPDAVLHEQTGLAVPDPDPILIADALQRLIEDRVLRERLGSEARIWAHQTFSLESNVRMMYEIYQRLVNLQARKR